MPVPQRTARRRTLLSTAFIGVLAPHHRAARVTLLLGWLLLAAITAALLPLSRRRRLQPHRFLAR